MQPIHIAAVNGETDVVHHLITKYKIDPRSVDQVTYYTRAQYTEGLSV